MNLDVRKLAVTRRTQFAHSRKFEIAVGNVESQKNEASGRTSEAINQFAEVFVLGDENAIFGECARQNFVVGCAAQRFGGIEHIVTVRAERLDEFGVAALVGQEVHKRCPLAKMISSWARWSAAKAAAA